MRDRTRKPIEVVFAREPFSVEFLSEMVPLIIGHFKEIARFKDISLEPDISHYKKADDAGVLRIYTARLDGRLVGYSVFDIYEHPHFKGSRQAHEELLYLDPVQRKGDLGDRLIKFCDEQIEKEGVDAIYHTVSVARDFSLLLIRRGYELSDRVYAKKLKGGIPA